MTTAANTDFMSHPDIKTKSCAGLLHKVNFSLDRGDISSTEKPALQQSALNKSLKSIIHI